MHAFALSCKNTETREFQKFENFLAFRPNTQQKIAQSMPQILQKSASVKGAWNTRREAVEDPWRSAISAKKIGLAQAAFHAVLGMKVISIWAKKFGAQGSYCAENITILGRLTYVKEVKFCGYIIRIRAV